LQTKKITVSTPVAALAVRGTDFWAGPIDGQYGVLSPSLLSLWAQLPLFPVRAATIGMRTQVRVASKWSAIEADGRSM
jgi:hypothetical protein